MYLPRFRSYGITALAAACLLFGGSAVAQSNKAQEKPKAKEEDPLKRELTPAQRRAQERALRDELRTYKRWLDEDVRWIITPEEMAAFKQLSNNEERDQFIEQFWLRRDPTPDTIENEYREEHYRRIAYANENFASGIPGSRTDRGRMYIAWGAPDNIDRHAGGAYMRPMSEGGGQTSAYPFEVWRYRYLEGVGQEVEIEFVDSCNCGDYKMEIDRSKKDALLMIPGAGMTHWEEMGMASRMDRFSGTNPERLGRRPGETGSSEYFDRMHRQALLNRPPPVKFKELQEIVDSKIRYNLMPFEVRADFVKVTNETVLVPVTVQVRNRDITFSARDGVAQGVVNIFGRVSTLTSRVVQTFEDTVRVDVPAELLERTQENASVYWKALPLRPGRYRLDLVVKDVNGDRLGTWSRGIVVPDFGEERLAHSTLILADLMERVPSRNVGTGNFVIGNTRVRPRVESEGKPARFTRNQKLNLWMQVYNLGVAEGSNRPNATIEYEVVNTANNQSVVRNSESTADLQHSGEQVTLEKSLPLDALEPGTYQLVVKVKDQISQQTISPTARFIVE